MNIGRRININITLMQQRVDLVKPKECTGTEHQTAMDRRLEVSRKETPEKNSNKPSNHRRLSAKFI